MAFCKAPRGNLDDSCMKFQSCMRRHINNNELCETSFSDNWDDENLNEGILLLISMFSHDFQSAG